MPVSVPARPPVEPQRHRDTEKEHREKKRRDAETQSRPRTSQTRRHKGTKATHATEKPQITQMNADVLTDVMRRCRQLTAEQPAIRRSPPAGGKPVSSGRKRPSQPVFPPADTPGARRFRLASLLFGRAASSIEHEGERSGEVCAQQSADRWIGPSRRTLAFGAIARSRGPWPSSDDGRDLATRQKSTSAFICVICGFFVGG